MCRFTLILILVSLFGLNNCHLRDLGEVYKPKSDINIIGKVLGGYPVILNQFPFNVQFINSGGICGGSILDRKLVLTAAHCFDFNKKLSEMKIFSNAQSLFDPNSNKHDVWYFTLHRNYNKTGIFSNDIALISIGDEFDFGPRVQVARIAGTNSWKNPSASFIVTGWGETKYKGLKSKKGLLMAEMSYVPTEICAKVNHIVISPGTFCLYGGGLADVCRGDSGGGVVWNGTLVGITSYGRPCGEAPSMFTDVRYYLSWLQHTRLKHSGMLKVFRLRSNDLRRNRPE